MQNTCSFLLFYPNRWSNIQKFEWNNAPEIEPINLTALNERIKIERDPQLPFQSFLWWYVCLEHMFLRDPKRLIAWQPMISLISQSLFIQKGFLRLHVNSGSQPRVRVPSGIREKYQEIRQKIIRISSLLRLFTKM